MRFRRLVERLAVDSCQMSSSLNKETCKVHCHGCYCRRQGTGNIQRPAASLSREWQAHRATRRVVVRNDETIEILTEMIWNSNRHELMVVLHSFAAAETAEEPVMTIASIIACAVLEASCSQEKDSAIPSESVCYSSSSRQVKEPCYRKWLGATGSRCALPSIGLSWSAASLGRRRVINVAVVQRP